MLTYFLRFDRMVSARGSVVTAAALVADILALFFRPLSQAILGAGFWMRDYRSIALDVGQSAKPFSA